MLEESLKFKDLEAYNLNMDYTVFEIHRAFNLMNSDFKTYAQIYNSLIWAIYGLLNK